VGAGAGPGGDGGTTSSVEPVEEDGDCVGSPSLTGEIPCTSSKSAMTAIARFIIPSHFDFANRKLRS
jgi:hypothetical protein